MYVNTRYLGKVYRVNNFTNTVKIATNTLRKYRQKHKFDAIAFTGTSGAALAYPLSYTLKIPLICVRKSTRDNHFGSKVEGCYSVDKYIIVDDFIDTGSTIEKIQKAIKEEIKEAKLMGIYLYNTPSKSSRCDFDFGIIPIIKALKQ